MDQIIRVFLKSLPREIKEKMVKDAISEAVKEIVHESLKDSIVQRVIELRDEEIKKAINEDWTTNNQGYTQRNSLREIIKSRISEAISKRLDGATIKLEINVK